MFPRQTNTKQVTGKALGPGWGVARGAHLPDLTPGSSSTALRKHWTCCSGNYRRTLIKGTDPLLRDDTTPFESSKECRSPLWPQWCLESKTGQKSAHLLWLTGTWSTHFQLLSNTSDPCLYISDKIPYKTRKYSVQLFLDFEGYICRWAKYNSLPAGGIFNNRPDPERNCGLRSRGLLFPWGNPLVFRETGKEIIRL